MQIILKHLVSIGQLEDLITQIKVIPGIDSIRVDFLYDDPLNPYCYINPQTKITVKFRGDLVPPEQIYAALKR